jgi:hypothetical protein
MIKIKVIRPSETHDRIPLNIIRGIEERTLIILGAVVNEPTVGYSSYRIRITE